MSNGVETLLDATAQVSDVRILLPCLNFKDVPSLGWRTGIVSYESWPLAVPNLKSLFIAGTIITCLATNIVRTC